MEIAFDNDYRFKRKSYLMEYRGIRFKLIQDNPRRWADHLLAVIPEYSEEYRRSTFSIASEFVSALSWQNRSRMSIWEAGGRSWHGNLPMSRISSTMHTFSNIPFGGSMIGASPSRIAHIKNEDQRVALMLYREARASNSVYLSLLFYWQVMEVGGNNPVSFVNKCQVQRPRELTLVAKEYSRLPLSGRKLGEYLQDEGRHAIAHIRRKPGKKKLEIDDVVDRYNMQIAVHICRALAEYYVSSNLKLTDTLTLLRHGRNGFPKYLADDERGDGRWKLAYP